MNRIKIVYGSAQKRTIQFFGKVEDCFELVSKKDLPVKIFRKEEGVWILVCVLSENVEQAELIAKGIM
jgi:hypothetical protein